MLKNGLRWTETKPMGLLQAVVIAMTMVSIIVAWRLTLELEALEDQLVDGSST